MIVFRRLAVLGALLLAGCSTDLVGVRLVVRTTDLAAPDDFDLLRVTVMAFASGAAGPTCTPVPVDAGPGPFTLLVEKGTVYSASVAFRVDAIYAGGTVVWYETNAVPWPQEGVVDISVVLSGACLGRDCGVDVPMCDEGSCATRPLGNAFEQVGSEPCLEDSGGTP